MKDETHFVCDEILKKDGGYAECCGCIGHTCKETSDIFQEKHAEEVKLLEQAREILGRGIQTGLRGIALEALDELILEHYKSFKE